MTKITLLAFWFILIGMTVELFFTGKYTEAFVVSMVAIILMRTIK